LASERAVGKLEVIHMGTKRIGTDKSASSTSSRDLREARFLDRQQTISDVRGGAPRKGLSPAAIFLNHFDPKSQ